jgi:FkbM family methyltransferase
MNTTNYSLPLILGEWLYKNTYSIYKPLYFFYKRMTEQNEINLLEKHINKNDTVVDIGSNIGFYTILISKLVGQNGKVYAFEPDKLNFERLKKNTHHLKNVVLENKAVGKKTELIKLYYSELNVDHRTYPINNANNFIEIQSVSLNEYFENKEKIDFIKMDIQGYEPYALQGMTDILEKNKNIKLLSEFWPFGLEESGYSALQYFKYLKNFFSNIMILQKNQLVELSESNISSLKLSPKFYYTIFAYND